jgi:hypothetical protein
MDMNATATKTFATYKAAADYVASREAEVGAMKFRSTEEYRDLYPHMAAMYQAESNVLAECFGDLRHSGERAADEAYANARLIAAAPDLLDALREANALINAPAEDLKDGVLSRIRAAIAKATA